jgi:hypothetical protein
MHRGSRELQRVHASLIHELVSILEVVLRIPLLGGLLTTGVVLVAGLPCTTAEEAKAIAESGTLGEAVTVRRIEQSDGTPGWEVLVHMPGKKQGWRCCIDQDMGKLRWKEAIPNPPSKVGCRHGDQSGHPRT